jgi:hypothetical protein
MEAAGAAAFVVAGRASGTAVGRPTASAADPPLSESAAAAVTAANRPRKALAIVYVP